MPHRIRWKIFYIGVSMTRYSIVRYPPTDIPHRIWWEIFYIGVSMTRYSIARYPTDMPNRLGSVRGRRLIVTVVWHPPCAPCLCNQPTQPVARHLRSCISHRRWLTSFNGWSMLLSDNSQALDIMYEGGRGDEAKVLFLSPQGGHFIAVTFPNLLYWSDWRVQLICSEIIDTI